jgi:hypothetical protein
MAREKDQASLSNIALTSLTDLKDGMCLHEGIVVEAGLGWLACHMRHGAADRR